MESRSAADGKHELSEGASGMPFFQQRQRTTASGRPSRDGWLFKFAQPASRALSPLFSPSEHHHQHDPFSQIHPPGTEPPRDYIKPSTHESHYHLQEKEQLAFPETSLPQIKRKREFIGDKQGNAYEGRGLAEIEQLLKQKMFTRDETNCLIELLRSRTIDLPYFDGHASKIAAEAVEAMPQRDAITLKPENIAVQPDQVTRNVYDTLQSTDNREVGSSPVDIAKAYMQALASTSGTQNKSGRPRTGKIRCNDDDESRLTFSTAINTPTKSQGAVVQGALGYCTPQTQRGSVVLRNFARSHYSHTPVSRSISKFQDGGWSPKVSTTGWKQSCTPLFGANMTMKRKSSVLDDDLKSIGTTPRLVRQKNIASATLCRAGPSDVQKSLPNFSENFESLEGNASIFQRNIEHSSSKGSKGNLMMSRPSDGVENRPAFISGSLTVHPRSSEIARKILDHINRSVPSPKEKALELKKAITRTVVHSDSTTLISDSKENRPIVNLTNNQFADCLIGRASCAQESVDTLEVPVRPSSRQSVGKDLLSSYPQGTPFASHLAKPWPHFSAHESVLKSITDSILSEEPKLSEESSKPSDDGTLTIFDNVSGFTFPIPVDSVASSEPPPTPTLFSFVATGMKSNLATEGIPSFTFGSRGAGTGPVFSFAAISSNTNIDTTSPKFHFGSNNKCMPFMSSDKDTVCCL